MKIIPFLLYGVSGFMYIYVHVHILNQVVHWYRLLKKYLNEIFLRTI